MCELFKIISKEFKFFITIDETQNVDWISSYIIIFPTYKIRIKFYFKIFFKYFELYLAIEYNLIIIHKIIHYVLLNYSLYVI